MSTHKKKIYIYIFFFFFFFFGGKMKNFKNNISSGEKKEKYQYF